MSQKHEDHEDIARKIDQEIKYIDDLIKKNRALKKLTATLEDRFKTVMEKHQETQKKVSKYEGSEDIFRVAQGIYLSNLKTMTQAMNKLLLPKN